MRFSPVFLLQVVASNTFRMKLRCAQQRVCSSPGPPGQVQTGEVRWRQVREGGRAQVACVLEYLRLSDRVAAGDC